MNKNIFPLMALLLVLSLGTGAQENPAAGESPRKGIEIEVDSRIDSMLALRTRNFISEKYRNGFTIQLYNGNIREARNIMSRFKGEFPQVSTELIHEDPEYKVLAGVYSTKEEAHEQLLQIKSKFSGAFVRQRSNN